MNNKLFYIDSGYFCAGAIIDKTGTCIEAAPIINYMIGKTFNWINYYVKTKKRWTISEVDCG